MATKWQKAVKQVVTENVTGVDKFVMKGNGTVEVKHSYFYTFGSSASKWAAKVEAKMVEMGVEFSTVTSYDNWAQWPQTSYFVAVVSPKA